jgi:cell division protein FtsL
MKKTILFIIYGLFILGLIVLGVMFIRSQRKLREMRKNVSQLKSELIRKKTEYLSLRQEMYNLEHNPHIVEKVAREKFKLVSDDEVIYKYDPTAIEKKMKKDKQ